MKNAWLENKIDACIDLAYCYNQVKCKDMYLSSLFRSFELDKPRAKVCSLIGIHFMQKEKYDLDIRSLLAGADSKKIKGLQFPASLQIQQISQPR